MTRADSSPAETAARIVGKRFRVLAVLARGGGVETLHVHDELTGEEAVLKTIPHARLAPGALQRLERDAHLLGGLSRSGSPPLLELGREDDLHFLVMPFVRGLPLRRRLETGPLAIREMLEVARCVLRTLVHAHGAGVLHGNLRPENIVVDAAPAARATLIDFGLARIGQLDVSARDLPVDSLRYTAPEQAGMLDRGVDQRADLYSLGLVMHECATGRPAFAAASVGDLLREHLVLVPPELRRVGQDGVPRCLDEVIQRLVRKDPRDRYHTAAGVLADLDEIAAQLERGVSEPVIAIGSRDRRVGLTEPAFIGRQQELAALDGEVDAARRGRGQLVLLEAESGGGKSRLLEEAARRAMERGTWVLRGSASGHAAHRPLQLFDGVVDQVAGAARADPDWAESFARRVADRREALVAALPRLVPVLGAAKAAGGPEEFGEARTITALAALLDALGSEDRPALVIFDDAQWSDGLVHQVLRRWQARIELEPRLCRWTAVLVGFRSEEVAREHALRELPASQRLHMRPLNVGDVRSLAESMAGILPDEAIDVIDQLSEGLPFLVGAVLQGLVETGALVESTSGWKADPSKLSLAQSSRRAAAFLAARLTQLSPGAGRLLAAGAVLGRQFDLSTAAMLARLEPDEVPIAVDESRRRRVVWLDAQELRCTFIHDRLRETLLQQIDAAELRRLHLAAALHLEAVAPDRALDLAYHFGEAGDAQRAFVHALTGAQQARAQYSLEIAERLYRLAERGADAAEPAVRLCIGEGLGDVLMMRKSFAEAEAEYLRAREFATSRLSQASLTGKLGELAMRRGDPRSSGRALVAALQLLGYRTPPRSRLLLFLMLLWEVLVQVAHTHWPSRFVGRRAGEGSERERLALQLHGQLVRALYYTHGPLELLWVDLRELNLGERYRATQELARIYSLHAITIASVPMYRRAARYAQRALAIRSADGDAWGQGHALLYDAMVLYQASRIPECLGRAQEAARLLGQAGDFQEMGVALGHTVYCLWRLGRCQEAAVLARRMYEEARAIRQRLTIGVSVGLWVLATEGAIPEDVARAWIDNMPDDTLVRPIVLRGRARQLMMQGGDLSEALDLSLEAEAIGRKQGKRNEYMAMTPLLTAGAARMLALRAFSADERGRLLGEARKALDRGMALARRFRNNLPHALRECGLVAAMRSDTPVARRLLSESMRVAEQQEQRYEWALSATARGRLGSRFGWPGAAADLEAGRRARAQMGLLPEPAWDRVASPVPVRTAGPAQPGTPSLIDRFATIQAVGRDIASALSEDAVFAGVRDGTLKLLRGEGCVVMGRPAGAADVDAWAAIAGEEGEGAVDRALLGRAVLARGAVSSSSEELEPAGRSEIFGGVRSALCAPVLVRGQVEACLYTLHRTVHGLFGEDERRMADFIGTIAGAALENVRFLRDLEEAKRAVELQHREVAALNEELEARVAERTLALSQANTELTAKIGELERTRQALATASRKAGMADVAATVLHDVGNVLNSVNVSALGVADTLRASKAPMVGKVAAALLAHRDDLGSYLGTDERGALIPSYLGGLATTLERERDQVLEEIRSLQRNVDRIKVVIAAQQAHAVAGGGVIETIDLNDLLDQALASEESLARGQGIELERDYAEVGSIEGDRHKLLQVVVQLLANARQALEGCDVRRIRVTSMRSDAEGIAIEVSDTGCGIPAENRMRIFNHGFTTRRNGNGFGLHASACAAVEMRGRLTAHSDGPGRGACFRIELPRSPGHGPSTGAHHVESTPAL